MGRISYYKQRLVSVFEDQGLKGVAALGIGLLIRRYFFLNFFAETFEYRILARFRSVPKTILNEIEIGSYGPKILIYASFDTQSKIRPYVLDQLRYFSDLQYSIIFISTSPSLGIHEIEKIRPFVRRIIHRKNEGYDFASYRSGFESIQNQLPNTVSLIVMNDSCQGPKFDFRERIELMIKDKSAVWGITKSYEISEYIQSYFFHFGSDLIQNGTVAKYFSRALILNSKWAIVRFLEIGGSKWLANKGVRLEALVDPAMEDIKLLMNRFRVTDPTRNPVAEELVRLGILPFLKKSLGKDGSRPNLARRS